LNTQHHILIVEDEKAIRESLQDMLEINGYVVAIAENGLEGLKSIQEQKPNLIISDVMMPFMDGFELLRVMKSSFETELIPIIMLTAKVELESKLYGLELGADDYITKPFEFRELNLKINNLLVKHKKLTDNINRGVKATSQDVVFIKKLHLLLDEQIDNSKLSIDIIASQLNMSISTFSRWHKKIIKSSPNQYLKEYRLNRAKEMIQLNYGNVSEIALKTGFSSLSYFSTVYTDFFGINPSDDYPTIS